MTKHMTVANHVIIEPGQVALSTWRRLLREGSKVKLADGACSVVEACHAAILDLIGTGRPIYTVNTGFGKLAAVRIEQDQLEKLQVAYFNYANCTVLGLGAATDGDILGLSPGNSENPDHWSHG